LAKLVKIDFPPGVARRGTLYEAQGRWYDSSLVRWYEGGMYPIGGWSQRTTVAVNGMARALLAWQDNTGAWRLAVGTNTKLYALTQSQTDLTGADISPADLVTGRADALDGGGIRGNACKFIWWEPNTVKAALVTCGGLCPGLNSIIQGVTNCLWRDYGVRQIIGVTAGYNGLTNPSENEWIELNPELVSEIHMKGGSVLKAGRGGFDASAICDTLRAHGINMLFVIGGDGTQFAGHLLYEEARKRKLDVSIVGVPKSIDNDVLFVDKTFGFDSAV
jgi:hypothetical protein